VIYEVIKTAWTGGVLRNEIGKQGYRVVACTRGMPLNLINRATVFASYRKLSKEDYSPPSLTYCKTRVGRIEYAVFSKVIRIPSPLPEDNRMVYFAHIVMCEMSDLPKNSTPVAVMTTFGFFRDKWNEEPRFLKPMSKLPAPLAKPVGVPSLWKEIAGDAGWAGRALQDIEDKQNTACLNLIVPLKTDVLKMAEETIGLVLPQKSWDITFCTLYNQQVPDILCALRFCPEGEDIISDMRRRSRTERFLDMSSGVLPPLSSSEVTRFVEDARAGKRRVDKTPDRVANPGQRFGKRSANTERIDRMAESVVEGTAAGSARGRSMRVGKGGGLRHPALCQDSLDLNRRIYYRFLLWLP